MLKIITFFCFCIFLSSCSIHKCRYSNGWKFGLELRKDHAFKSELKAERAVKISHCRVDDTLINNQLVDKVVFDSENCSALGVTPKYGNHLLDKAVKFNSRIVFSEINNSKVDGSLKPQSTDGKIKVLRSIFTILGIVALILAVVFITLAIIHLSYAWLIASAASATLSYILLFIGKRKLDLGGVEIKRKRIKLFRDIALVFAGITMAVWMVLRLFYG